MHLRITSIQGNVGQLQNKINSLGNAEVTKLINSGASWQKFNLKLAATEASGYNFEAPSDFIHVLSQYYTTVINSLHNDGVCYQIRHKNGELVAYIVYITNVRINPGSALCAAVVRHAKNKKSRRCSYR